MWFVAPDCKPVIETASPRWLPPHSLQRLITLEKGVNRRTRNVNSDKNGKEDRQCDMRGMSQPVDRKIRQQRIR
jgi:hypothetical protein